MCSDVVDFWERVSWMDSDDEGSSDLEKVNGDISSVDFFTQ